MRPGTKLAAFAVVLAAAFGVGAAVGNAVGPIDTSGGTAHQQMDSPSEPVSTQHEEGH